MDMVQEDRKRILDHRRLSIKKEHDSHLQLSKGYTVVSIYTECLHYLSNNEKRVGDQV